MFEIGRKYEFKMIEGDREIVFSGHVDSYEHPLVRLAEARHAPVLKAGGLPNLVEPFTAWEDMTVVPRRIINVTSPNFVGAVAATK